MELNEASGRPISGMDLSGPPELHNVPDRATSRRERGIQTRDRNPSNGTLCNTPGASGKDPPGMQVFSSLPSTTTYKTSGDATTRRLSRDFDGCAFRVPVPTRKSYPSYRDARGSSHLVACLVSRFTRAWSDVALHKPPFTADTRTNRRR